MILETLMYQVERIGTAHQFGKEGCPLQNNEAVALNKFEGFLTKLVEN